MILALCRPLRQASRRRRTELSRSSTVVVRRRTMSCLAGPTRPNLARRRPVGRFGRHSGRLASIWSEPPPTRIRKGPIVSHDCRKIPDRHKSSRETGGAIRSKSCLVTCDVSSNWRSLPRTVASSFLGRRTPPCSIRRPTPCHAVTAKDRGELGDTDPCRMDKVAVGHDSPDTEGQRHGADSREDDKGTRAHRGCGIVFSPATKKWSGMRTPVKPSWTRSVDLSGQAGRIKLGV